MVEFKKFTLVASLCVAALLTGCANTADTLGPNVYDATQVNTIQEAKTVKIISVIPAKVAVDNTQNKRAAQAFGGVLGAVGGAVLGYNVGSGGSAAATTAGGIGGAAAGAAAGSFVNDKKIVEGVTITYSERNKIYISTQTGRMCEYKPGTALVVMTKANETRIQPNAVCPDTNKK